MMYEQEPHLAVRTPQACLWESSASGKRFCVGEDFASEKEKTYSDEKQKANKKPSNTIKTEINTEKVIDENTDNADADFLNMINRRSWSLCDFEQTHIKHGDVKTNSVLSSTNYLDEILKKRKK